MAGEPLELDGSNLTMGDVINVAVGGRKVRLAEHARLAVESSRADLGRIASSSKPVYGVNTGFGAFSDIRIRAEEAARLSQNLILSHAAAVGPPFPRETTRAAILIRANTLAGGNSGVSPAVIDALIQLLNANLTPEIPAHGSLGSSGDLAPLAHLGLYLTAGLPSPALEGSRAWLGDDLVPASEAIRSAGVQQVTLGAKDGLALTNGATFSAAQLVLAINAAQSLLLQAEVVAAMTFEALLGASQAFDERLHRARPHPGQMAVAGRLRRHISGSQLIDTGNQVQDPYSLRCIPQVHGPAHDLLQFVAQIATTEINSATDNPLIFGNEALSGGNFHGEPLGLAADYLKLPLCEVGALAERRLFLLTSPQSSRGLPPMLVAEADLAGLESGMMMLQYTAAALVLEMQALATSDAVKSIPTSAGQEDLNANSTTAARRLTALIARLRTSLAIEWIASGQALELRRLNRSKAQLGAGTRIGLQVLRDHVDFVDHDRPPHVDIAAADLALAAETLLERLEAELGPLPAKVLSDV